MRTIGAASIVTIATLGVLSSVTAQGRNTTISSDAAVPEARIGGFVSDLASDDQGTCARAAASLGSLGKAAASAVPDLVSVLARERGVVLDGVVMPARPLAVSAVIDALGRIGASAVPALVAAARDTSDDGTRDLLTLALVRIGSDARPGLLDLSRSGSSDESRWAHGTLERIDATGSQSLLACTTSR